MARFIIEGGHPIKGVVRPNGNKNEALPALMACLLSDKPVTLRNIPKIQDVLIVCQILQKLGVEVSWETSNCVHLCAAKAHSYRPNTELCSRVRASILLMGPLLARFGKVQLARPGGDVIGARRLDTHFDGFSDLGCRLVFGREISAVTEDLKAGDIYLDEPSVTATENIMLLAACIEGKTRIYNAACEPHICGLGRLLVGMGAKISGLGSNIIEIEGSSSLGGADHEIAADFIEVGSYLCLGAIGRGNLEILGVPSEELRFIRKTLAKIGISWQEGNNGEIYIDGNRELNIQTDLGGRIGNISSGPWPAFPTDLMSVALVAATQARGTIVFHEKMYEGRMFFTDKLLAMGANIVLCDPHRAVVTGPARLSAARMSSPDVRAGMALVMAAALANGVSEIDNIYQIERGYGGIFETLSELGVAIRRKD